MRGIMRCAGGKSAGEVSTVRERVSGWLYLLGWTVVCRMPRRWAEWMFRQIADQLWRRQGPAGFQNSATGAELGFYAARSYSLMRPPRTSRRLIRWWERSATG